MKWPHARWNVLVERAPGGHFYYSEEQFNIEYGRATGRRLTIAIFDRRCHTLEHWRRMASISRTS